MHVTPTDDEKKAIWDAYRRRQPTRVPLFWGANVRIILLDPALNPEGWTFRDYFHEPRVTLTVQARFQEHQATVLNRYCDWQVALPTAWRFWSDPQNVYDAAFFGAEVNFEPNQVPGTRPCYTIDQAEEFLRRDYSRPLETLWIRERLAYQEALQREAAGFTYAGRSGTVEPFRLGFDGPVTAIANLFGTPGIELLGAEPEMARRLLEKISADCLNRNQALAGLAGGWQPGETGWLADDSIALISPAMYRRLVLPAHRWWYDRVTATPASAGRRSIHLCGDATHHFVTLRDELGVHSFDTGFPVDHGTLRRQLGPQVEISGGPHVALLSHGTPDECAAETSRILRSGIKEGGRFLLREGNNLPPLVPLANLEAVYRTCQEHGCY